MNHCKVCNSPICQDRAEFLLEAGRPFVCIGCSTETPSLALMDYSHKTAPSLVVIGGNKEQVRMAKRAFRRAR